MRLSTGPFNLSLFLYQVSAMPLNLLTRTLMRLISSNLRCAGVRVSRLPRFSRTCEAGAAVSTSVCLCVLGTAADFGLTVFFLRVSAHVLASVRSILDATFELELSLLCSIVHMQLELYLEFQLWCSLRRSPDTNPDNAHQQQQQQQKADRRSGSPCTPSPRSQHIVVD